MDDGSTDQSAQVAEACGATVLTMDRTIGVGAALRLGYRYAVEHGFDVAVVMAGNNKDAPRRFRGSSLPSSMTGRLRSGFSVPER